MSNICKLPLFSIEENNLDFLTETIKKSTLENISENIASLLKKQASFATVENDTEDTEEYEENVTEKLIPEIINLIEHTWKTILTPKSRNELTKELTDLFISSKDTELKENDIPTTKSPNDNKKTTSLKELRNILFGGENLLLDYHIKTFKLEIKERIIFDKSSTHRSLVYNKKTLNENLKLYKQNLYETIYDFCIQNNIPVKNIRKYYGKNNNVRGEEVLDAFYEYLLSLDKNSKLATLEKDWEQSVLKTKSKEISLLDAVNSYLIITKFDDLIRELLGKFISINTKLDEPIETIEVNNREEIVYKYSFGRRTSNMLKDFRDVMLNALDTMGNFSKFLIEIIPRIDSSENITQVQFINSLLHLKEAINRLPYSNLNNRLKELIETAHDNPKENWKAILDIFANKSNYSNFLEFDFFTTEDINIILSIHRFLYGKSASEKEESIHTLEKEIHNEDGFKEIYSLEDTLLGTIDSVSEMNYGQVEYDSKTKSNKISIKRKYYSDKYKLDLIDGINLQSSLELSERNKTKYGISYLNGPFKFEINGHTISILSNNSELGIFSDNVNVTIDGLSIESYFKDISLNGTLNRNDILKAKSGKEKDLMDILEYIHGALSLGLHLNNEGLLKLYVYLSSRKKGLSDLIHAASRVYIIKDLNSKFNNSIKNGEINPRTESEYTILNFKDWLYYNSSLVPVILFTKPDNDENQKYFKIIGRVTHLVAVQTSEEWIDDLGKAHAIIAGESLKATTKDYNRNNIPNYSPAFLGSEIKQILNKDSKNTITKNLLLSTQSDTIRYVVIDTDVKVSTGEHKSVSDMNEAELQYHFFVNKFLLPFHQDKSFYSLPTVYSDKKKFINYVVNLLNVKLPSGKKLTLGLDNSEIVSGILNSLGTYYKEILNNVLNDYAKLFGINPDIETVLNELKKYNIRSLMKKVDEYNKYNPSDRLEFILDLHYRSINGRLGLNETLVYYSEVLYKDINNLTSILKTESLNYVNTLLNSGVIFDTTTGFKDALATVANEIGVRLSDWISGNNLILAKIHHENGDVENIVAGDKIDASLNIEINPILEKYVLLHNLINNNLRENIIGTDNIHKIKIKPANFNESDQALLKDVIPNFENVDLVDAYLAINALENKTIKGLGSNPSKLKLNKLLKLNNLKNKITSLIRSLLSAALNAQLKRTVPIPGTMRYYLLNTLTGITPTLRCAIILDVHASVFNFEGEIKNDLEAHDGGAYLNPLTAILQNNSLLDSEVGDIIKPLWHVSVPNYGSKRLIKYAAHTMSNSMMLNSELSEISMYKMFKKMTNIRWNNEYNSEDKNLLNQYNHRQNDPEVRFTDITSVSGNIYFTLGDKTYQIINFGWDLNGYYTREQEVEINPSNKKVVLIPNTKVKYYHYFDDNGKQYKIKAGEQIPEGLHTIDSIYELHQVFGGIYSQSYQDGKFISSNSSLLATTAIINMVSRPTDKYNINKSSGKDIEETLEFYYQPLKYKMVDYLINLSAIKNGTANINFREAYLNPENELNTILDDAPLRYIEMDTLRYGIQQDSEHDVDDEELTEMTQVISAIDAGGHYHQEVLELYNAIGILALKAANVELSKIKLFNENPKNKNILYDLVGRILIEHLSFNRGSNGLAENLINKIKNTFSLSSEHVEDVIKIPFSDLTIYNLIISTISSILNKKSVKRKFPGTGQVMVPGYNIVLLWNFNGIDVRYEDLIKEAKNSGYISSETNPLEYNKDIVKQYLLDKLTEYAKNHTKNIPIKIDGTTYESDFWEDLLLEIDPIDIVLLTINGELISPIKLDKIEDYYLFKNDLLLFIKSKNLYSENILSISVVKRIDIPRNLSPLKASFTYVDKLGISHRKNIYDLWAVKDMYFELEKYKQSEEYLNPELNNYLKNKLLELKRIQLRNKELSILNKLDSGIYLDKDGNEYKVTELNSTAAETLMSNIYLSKFGLNPGESLYDVLKAGPKRFEKNPLKLLPKENIFDLAFVKTNGESILLSFDDNEIKSLRGYYKVKENKFKNINKHYIINKDGKYIDEITGKEIPNKTIDGRTIASNIYLLDNNNSEIVQIGVELDVSNDIEFLNGKYIDKKTKQEITNREFTLKDGRILEYILFVERKTVKPKLSNKYTIYNIKKSIIKDIFGDKKIYLILGELYDLDNYGYILPPRFINPNNVEEVKKSINYLQKHVDLDLKEYLLNLYDGIYKQQINILSGFMIPVKGYSSYYTKYNKILSEKIFNSFKESLNFISSRIPAQSLQSFMKMKVVGFTSSGANLAYVSHWLTWLLGSDYDIDKSYMLGNEFDDNGLYLGWSPLFDYFNLEISKKLPFPTGVDIYTPDKITGDEVNIENYVEQFNKIELLTENSKLLLFNDIINYLKTIENKEIQNIVKYFDNLLYNESLLKNLLKKISTINNIKNFNQDYNQILNTEKSLKLLLYIDLIKYINKHKPEDDKGIKIWWKDDENNRIRTYLVSIIKKHNKANFNLDKSQAVLKNFISNKLLLVILGTKNFIGSHAPITMDDLHTAADSSSNIGEEWTTMNPGYIPLMLTQNMVGKKGVGIAANGQKASFIWKYWMTNEINTDSPNKKYVRFPSDFTINRIEGRFGGSPIDKRISRLPDINMYNASDSDKLEFSFVDDHYVPSDLMSSQMISAATDNAKELILDKINANTDLAKVYMYLITLGFDVKDIVSFMTSPIINLIARNSSNNIFLGTNWKTEDVANYILKRIDLELDIENKSNTPSIKNYTLGLDSKIETLIENIKNKAISDEDYKLKLENMKLDIQEFIKIYSLSEEFSNLGRLLGINQGVPTTKEKLLSFKKFVEDIIRNRENKLGIVVREKNKSIKNDESIPSHLKYLVDNFDFDMFLKDESYRQDVIEYYDILKGSVNIFALVENTPLFKSILDIANIINVIDLSIVAKSKAMDNIFKKIQTRYPYASSQYGMQILPILNLLLVSYFIKNNNFEVPVKKGWKYVDLNFDLQEILSDCNLNLGSSDFGLDLNSSITSFHYIMDKYIIPQIKDGELYPELKTNYFIQNLVPVLTGGKWKYKLNLDLNAIQNNPESKIILKNILKDLQELLNYEFGNITLLDGFMLYNLVVDLNQVGSDRLTDLFGIFVNEYNTSNDNLMLNYFKFIGETDFNSDGFNKLVDSYSLNDYLISIALPVSSERGHREPSIKVLNNDGTISFKYSVGFKLYKDFGDLLPVKVGESLDLKLTRLNRREQFGFGFIYSDFISSVITDLLNFNDSESWIDVLQRLVSNDYIKINIDCS